MGIFSSIGSLFGPAGMVVGALADTSMAKKQQQKVNAAQEAAYQRQLEAERVEAEKNRALAKGDAASKFTDMTAAAQKAGINPLTALRTTGGAGFGSYGGYQSQVVAPVLSQFSFARTFASNVGSAYFNKKINEPIDKYNKQIRELELAQRRKDLKLTLQSPKLSGPQSVPLMGKGGKPVTDEFGNPIYVPVENFEAIPQYINVYDQATGQIFPMLNPELTESGPTELALAAGVITATKSAVNTGQDIELPFGFTIPVDPSGLSYGQLSSGPVTAAPFPTPVVRQ